MLKLVISDRNITVTTEAKNSKKLIRKAQSVVGQIGGWCGPILCDVYVGDKLTRAEWGNDIVEAFNKARTALAVD